MDRQLLEKLIELSKTKKTGVYSYKNHYYAVRNGQLKFISDYFGNVLEFSYGFVISSGRISERSEIRKELFKLLTN